MKRLFITLIGKTGRVSLFLLFFILFLFDDTNVYALDFLGPPAAETKKWQLSTGFEYSLSSMDFKLINGSWKENDGSVMIIDLDVDDVHTDKMSLYLGYGIEQNWELFVRLGSVSSEFEQFSLDETGKFDSDYTPSVGIGLRMTFFENDRLKVGGVVQADWYRHNGQINPSVFITPSYVTMEIKEAQIAAGAIYRLTDFISIYGGPFYHYLTGEFDYGFVSVNYLNQYELVTFDYSWDIEISSEYGGYLGTNINFMKEFSLNLEYQLTGSADVIGANAVLRF